ncbi:hypothetical protein PsorP6_000679 [Peronosclerospora sorghi]|uniref:Uncharacterized protein n=1 Tax=Peronosclerospora sorghi TaxID=230839 RepID=A0ACC0WRG3_9STRA|nr:hypothetical protein PsorP6_000679 [Peronosclerospora sorghi]
MGRERAKEDQNVLDTINVFILTSTRLSGFVGRHSFANMAFRREVPSLEKMALKFISKSPRQLEVILNDQTLERAHRIGKPTKSRRH